MVLSLRRVALFMAAGLVMACGPSLRRTYQSDNAFARCFDMDYNPGATVPEKQYCWVAWLSSHAYNQPADKVAYANLRLEELEKGLSIPGPPGPPGSFDKRPDPPKEFVEAKSKPEPTPPAASLPASPKTEEPQGAKTSTEPCEASCKTAFNACHKACESDEGIAASCTSACDDSYRSCMKACFD